MKPTVLVSLPTPLMLIGTIVESAKVSQPLSAQLLLLRNVKESMMSARQLYEEKTPLANRYGSVAAKAKKPVSNGYELGINFFYGMC